MGHLGEDVIRRRDNRINHVSHTAKPPYTDDSVSGNFVRFESRDVKFGEILAALQNNEVYMLGLYGMGGSGKTTLAKQVAMRALEWNVFDRVVFSSVSPTPNFWKIQDEIAEGLGLKLSEETLEGRGGRMSLRLRSEDRILIIVDDVWSRLDLSLIGIPPDGNSNHMGCKVLLTTRNVSVCSLMKCHLSINLYLLSDEESWSLFKRLSAIDHAFTDPDLLSAGKEIVKLCRGLPIAIEAVGSSLKDKTADEWKSALRTLQLSTGSVRSILKLSYDNIPSKVAQSLFLMCGLFPEDDAILIEDLTHFAFTLGLRGKTEVNEAISSLIDGSLLMRDETSREQVRMHDLVRDVALFLVVEENPAHRDSIEEYVEALRMRKNSQYSKEDFQWYEELGRLLRQLYPVRESPSSSSSSSTSNAALSGGEGKGREPDHQLVVPSYAHPATIPKPSGKLVDFRGLCQVDRSFLPLLHDACAGKPQLIECQRGHTEIFRKNAFESLGLLLFLLRNVRKRDWVYLKEELHIYWEQVKLMKFDLEWLSPIVEELFSSTEIARIEALQEQEKYWIAEADEHSKQLRLAVEKGAATGKEIARLKSKLDAFPIADVPDTQVVSKVPPWKKIFFKK